MKTTRVLLNIGPYRLPEASRQVLHAGCEDAEVIESGETASLEQFDGREVEVLASEEIPRDLTRWPRLRLVQLFSAGINHLNGHPIWQTAIPVATASGTHGVPIAEYVTAAVLMLAHRLPELMELKATRQWQPAGLDGSFVRGQTVGILGYGSIGRECARQLHALGMRIACLKRNPQARCDEGFNAWPGTGDPEGRLPERWFAPAQLPEMLPQCDVLVIATPATPETLGLVGRAQLALMKPTAGIINVARGGIVDEAALAEALQRGRLGGAVMDCFTREPLPADHPFFDTPRLILTPHMAGVYVKYWDVMANLLRENLRRSSEGRPVLNRVDPRAGY